MKQSKYWSSEIVLVCRFLCAQSALDTHIGANLTHTSPSPDRQHSLPLKANDHLHTIPRFADQAGQVRRNINMLNKLCAANVKTQHRLKMKSHGGWAPTPGYKKNTHFWSRIYGGKLLTAFCARGFKNRCVFSALIAFFVYTCALKAISYFAKDKQECFCVFWTVGPRFDLS